MALPFFAHACRLGAEGIVSKRVDGTYRSGPCPVWKVRDPARVAVQREVEQMILRPGGEPVGLQSRAGKGRSHSAHKP